MPDNEIDVEKSILLSTKKLIGLAQEYDAFDLDLKTHINSTFFILNQIGAGPMSGFEIQDETTLWEEFISTPTILLNAVKTFIYYRARLAFDPPPTSFGITALETQIQEYEWRIKIMADPAPPYDADILND